MADSQSNHSVKAMILAAGRGERMRPLTDHTPKPLLQVRGVALIDYHLHRLAGAGIHEVVINTCWLAEQIEQHVGDGSSYGLQVQYSREQEALETAGGIRQALDLLADEHGAGEFLILNADVYCADPMPQLSKPLSGNNLARLLLTATPDYLPGDFTLDSGKIQRKPAEATAEFVTYTGLGRYSVDMFKALPQGRLALLPLLLDAIDTQRLAGELLNGRWLDVGTPERLSAAQDETP